MICVSIGRGRHRHMIAEHRHLVDEGAELVELRLDYINGPVNLRRLLADRPGPVIITCRRECDGGKYSGAEDARQLLLRTAIAEGAEYVDLEEDIAADIPRFGQTKRVISSHDFRKTPKNLQERHERLASLDADVIKLATMANHPHDNIRMLTLVEKSKVPTVGVCMGDIGAPSRILAGRYGAPFTYATFHHERTLAPGQLTFHEMKDVYHYDEITSNTKVFGVIGDPIGHSLGPLVHNAAYRHLGLDDVYVAFRVPKEDLLSFIDDAREFGIGGLSITVPHKETVLHKLDRVDGAVKSVGAANTVVFENGQTVGYNTDYRAAMESLEAAMGGRQGDRSPVQGKTAIILGAGGVAKAICAGLVRRRAKVVIAARTARRGEKLAQRFSCKTIDWTARHMVSADILLNCTPLGMHPNVDETPFEKHHLKPSMTVFDTVYNPESTLLIKDARSRSCRVVTGADMFIRQAALQFQLFTRSDAPAERMHEVFKQAIGPVKY